MLLAARGTNEVLWPSWFVSTSRMYWNPQKSATLPGGRNVLQAISPVRNARPSKAMVFICASVGDRLLNRVAAALALLRMVAALVAIGRSRLGAGAVRRRIELANLFKREARIPHGILQGCAVSQPGGPERVVDRMSILGRQGVRRCASKESP